MIALVVILIVIGACLNVYLALSVVKTMADKSFMFTIVQEGTAKAVMTAGAGGAFDRFLMQYRGKQFKKDKTTDLEENEKELGDWGVVSSVEEKRTGKNKLGLRGIRWLGLPRFYEVYRYKFRGLSFIQEKDGTVIFERKDDITDYVDLRDNVIKGVVKDAEDADLVPLSIVLVFGIRIIDPFKVLFKTESSEWLKIMINTLIPIFRRKAIAVEKWVELQSAIDKKGLSQEYDKIIGNEKEILKNNYGMDVYSVEIQSIDPPDEVRDAALKPFIAEREAKAIVIKADVEKYRIETVYKALEERGELGQLVRRLEALETAAQSGKLVFSAPELTEITRGLGIGKETAEDLAKHLADKTPAEIAEALKKYLKK